MAEIAEIAKNVRQHWLSQGLRVLPVRPEDLESLQRLGPDGIPEAYGVFLRLAGLPDNEDSEGFRFWLPGEVRLTHDVLAEAGYASNARAPSIIIADYLQESWWYGLWLAGPLRGYISLVLGHPQGMDPQPPLGTFADFLLAYLNDEASLYPPAPRQEQE